MTTRDATSRIRKAEQSIVRAAMGIVNANGYAFTYGQIGEMPNVHVVLFPAAMKRLENAVHKLREARKARRKK